MTGSPLFDRSRDEAPGDETSQGDVLRGAPERGDGSAAEAALRAAAPSSRVCGTQLTGTDARPPDAPAHGGSAPQPEAGDDAPLFDFARTPLAPGRTLIEASAGTGKTFAIAGTVLRLVLDGAPLAAAPGGLPDLRRLLVVTFTDAATDELRRRIRQALRDALAAFARLARGDAPADVAAAAGALLRPFVEGGYAPGEAVTHLQAALDRVDEAAISTIHAFCKATLDRYALECGLPFDLALEEDGTHLATRAATDALRAALHGDERLSALALEAGLTPAALTDHLAVWARSPGATLHPDAPPVPDALAALDDALARFAAAWDAPAVRALAGAVRWNKNAPLATPEALDDLDALATGRAPEALAALDACRPDALRKAANARCGAIDDLMEHPAMAAAAVACGAVGGVRTSLTRHLLADAAARRERLRQRQGTLSLDDLITRLHDALTAPDTGTALAAALRAQFSFALIDEFQDTDARQYAIFRRAFAGRPLYLIGDPKQAIYRFRGADLHAYLGARREADRRFTLGTNFRSTPALVGAVNALFARAARPFVYQDIPFDEARPARPAPPDEKPALVWWTLPAEAGGRLRNRGDTDARAEAAVVTAITRLLDGGERLWRGTPRERPVAPADIAVLVRTNRQAQTLQSRLRAAGVPAVVGASGDVRKSRELAELETLLRAFARPEDDGFLRAALATTLWGWTAEAIARVAPLDPAGPPPSPEDERRYAAARAAVRDGLATWRRHGVLRALSAFFQQHGVYARLQAFPDAERRLTDLRHGLELLHEAERGRHRAPETLLRWFTERLVQTFRLRDQTEIRLESDALAVQLVTLHRSKGLQYPVVFLPYLWRGPGGESRDAKALVARHGARTVYAYDPQDPLFGSLAAAARHEETAEDLRLAYVGLTRAEERCYVLAPEARDVHLSSLGYLLLSDGHGRDGMPAVYAPGPEGAGVSAAGAEEAIGAWIEAAQNRAARNVATLCARIEALCEACPDTMRAEPLPDGPPVAWTATPGRASVTHRARMLPASVPERFGARQRLQSFSGWVARAHGAHALDEPLLPAPPEIVALVEDVLPALPSEVAPGPVSTHRDNTLAGALALFPAGVLPGRYFHDVLEHTRFADFAETTPVAPETYAPEHGAPEHGAPEHGAPEHGAPEQAVRERIRQALRRYALYSPREGEAHVELTLRLLRRLAALPLPGLGVTLGRADPALLANEWRFVLPTLSVSPKRLADCVAAHADDDALRAYAPALAALELPRADGYLSGTVDLLVCHEGRWLVLDWKSNRLGAVAESYGPEALREAMHGHHYTLQALLYTVALHRFLRARLGTAYAYDTHVAGTAWVFLRGLGEGAPDGGVHAMRPPEALVAALDALLGSGPPS